MPDYDTRDQEGRGEEGWCHLCNRDIAKVEDHAPGCAGHGRGPDHPEIAPLGRDIFTLVRRRFADDDDAYADEDLLARLYEVAAPAFGREPLPDPAEQEADELLSAILALAEHELGEITEWIVSAEGRVGEDGVGELEVRCWGARGFAPYRGEDRPSLRIINRLGEIQPA